VLASFRGERSMAEICRERDISEALVRRWRDQMGEAGMERYVAGQDRSLAERRVVLRAAARGSARIRLRVRQSSRRFCGEPR
jgi:transposase-like protein